MCLFMKVFFALIALQSINIEPYTTATRVKKLASERHDASSSAAALAPPPPPQHQTQQTTPPLPAPLTNTVAAAAAAGANLFTDRSSGSARIASGSGRQLEFERADRGLPFDLNEEPPLHMVPVSEMLPSNEGRPRYRSTRKSARKFAGPSPSTADFERGGEVEKLDKIDGAEIEDNEMGPEAEQEASSSAKPSNAADERGEMKPFYLKNLPPTKVGELFHAYEVRYWEARQGGQLPNLGKHVKFFITPKDQGLTLKERIEFRKLGKRFTDRLAERKPWKRKAIVAYQHRKYGKGPEKTEAQQEATQRRSKRTYLMSRLKLILASASATDIRAKVEWKETYDEMLQDIVAEKPLKPGDMLLELYKKMIEVKQMPSCIELPSSSN